MADNWNKNQSESNSKGHSAAKDFLPWVPRTTTSRHFACVPSCLPPLGPCIQWSRRRNRLVYRGRWPPYLSQNLMEERKQRKKAISRSERTRKDKTWGCSSWRDLPVILMWPSSSRRILQGEQNKSWLLLKDHFETHRNERACCWGSTFLVWGPYKWCPDCAGDPRPGPTLQGRTSHPPPWTWPAAQKVKWVSWGVVQKGSSSIKVVANTNMNDWNNM